MSEFMPLPSRVGLYALLGSTVLLGGAYYFQYVEHLAPCEMCLWQRYPHMISIVFGLLAALLGRRPQFALVCALVAVAGLLVTSGIGVFHFGVEQHLWKGPQACSGTIPSGLSSSQLKDFLLKTQMVRCDVPAWSMWHVSMAGWNAIFSGALAVLLVARILAHIRGGQTSLFK